MWDAGSGAEMRQFKGHDGKRSGRGGDAGRTPHRHRLGRQYGAGVGRQHRGRAAAAQRHPARCESVAVTPDGTRIITGSDDNIARVWDAGNGAELLQFKGHTGSLLAVAVMPDGRRIVTGSDDKTARVWDVSTGAELLQLKGITRLPTAWRSRRTGPGSSPVRTTILRGCGTPAAEPNCSSFTGHQSTVTAVAAMLDGGLIVTGSEDSTVADMERCHWGRAAQARWPHAPRHERGGHAGQRSHHHRFEGQDRAGVGRQSRHCPALAQGHTASQFRPWPSHRTGPVSSRGRPARTIDAECGATSRVVERRTGK